MRPEAALTRRTTRTTPGWAVIVGPVVLGIASVVGAGRAAADPHVEAVALFDQGIKDMKAGHLDKACPELAASLQLVKDSGTKGALARCHGLAGRVASAWLLWRELSDTAPSPELRADAAAQARKLERRLPRYAIKLAGPTPGLVVQVNGRAVAVDVPVAVPIDPGAVLVTAVGRDGERATTRTWSRDYTAVEGQTLAIEIPGLEPVAAEAPRRGSAASTRADHGDRDPGGAAARDDAAELAARRHRRHVVALAIGGAAIGAAAGGTVFGLDARSRYDDARRRCAGAIDRCPPDQLAGAQDRVDAARTAATRSNVLFGVAGAAAIAAVIVWVTAPSIEDKPIVLAPSVGDGNVGLVVGGAF